MKLFTKILALFQAPTPEPVVPSSYTDDEFLNVVMELARQRTQAEQAARETTQAPPTTPTHFPNAA
jgi:hypothetical protein